MPQAGELPPTRAQAEAIMKQVTDMYRGHATAAAGTHTLAWLVNETSTLNAFARNGAEWQIVVTAGWITAPNMTADLFSLTVCHEAGHLVGGFPYKSGRHVVIEAMGTAIAAESQADYFASKDCLPRLWANDTEENAAALASATPAQRARCETAGTPSDKGLCTRIVRASLQFAKYLAEQHAKEEQHDPVYPMLDTPDTSVSDRTKEGYPSDQCRIDTLLAGLACSVKNTGVGIPGLVAPYGELSLESQADARRFACQDGAGARPRCWFNPNDKPFDCSQFGESTCVHDDGLERAMYCNPTTGLTHYDCLQPQVCKMGPESGANCYDPDEVPEV